MWHELQRRELLWDPEAGVLVVTSADVPGLALESGLFGTLLEKVRTVVPELLVINRRKAPITTSPFTSERLEHVLAYGSGREKKAHRVLSLHVVALCAMQEGPRHMVRSYHRHQYDRGWKDKVTVYRECNSEAVGGLIVGSRFLSQRADVSLPCKSTLWGVGHIA